MFLCPECAHIAYIDTSRYLTTTVKESYFACTNSRCECRFKTYETFTEFISETESGDRALISKVEESPPTAIRSRPESYSIRLD